MWPFGLLIVFSTFENNSREGFDLEKSTNRFIPLSRFGDVDESRLQP